MSNSFNIDVKPEIAANLVQILSNASALATIQITDLPAIDALIDTVDAAVDTNTARLNTIINTELPDILTNVGVNTTALTTIAGIVADILEDTAALPQSFRGKFYQVGLSMDSSENALVVDVSGSGKVYMISLQLLDSADMISLTLNTDDKGFSPLTHTGDTSNHPLVFLTSSGSSDVRTLQILAEGDVRNKMINLEFESSLKLWIRRQAGTAANVKASIFYFLDTS